MIAYGTIAPTSRPGIIYTTPPPPRVPLVKKFFPSAPAPAPTGGITGPPPAPTPLPMSLASALSAAPVTTSPTGGGSSPTGADGGTVAPPDNTGRLIDLLMSNMFKPQDVAAGSAPVSFTPETTATGGGGGGMILFVVLLVVGGGYYWYKHRAA